jgi:REP element-mobilizing transposase RayT
MERRLPLLGQITDGQVILSPAGTMVATVWSNLGRYYPVEVDAFVVMPNHIHGILVLAEAARGSRDGADRDGEDRDGATVPTMRTVRAGAISLSTVIQRFKTFTMHEYGKGVARDDWPRYPGRLWQHRFHDHVIRNERELAAIREYIANNPLQWELDRENPDYIFKTTGPKVPSHGVISPPGSFEGSY